MSDQQQLQMVVAEVQNARQQVAALTSQIKEIELTLKPLNLIQWIKRFINREVQF